MTILLHLRLALRMLDAGLPFAITNVEPGTGISSVSFAYGDDLAGCAGPAGHHAGGNR